MENQEPQIESASDTQNIGGPPQPVDPISESMLDEAIASADLARAEPWPSHDSADVGILVEARDVSVTLESGPGFRQVVPFTVDTIREDIATLQVNEISFLRDQYDELLALNHLLAEDLAWCREWIMATGLCQHTKDRDRVLAAPGALYPVTVRECVWCGERLPLGKAADKYTGSKVERRAAELAAVCNGDNYGAAIRGMSSMERVGFEQGPTAHAGPERDVGALTRTITHTLDDVFEGY